jgi:hypothetical protein
MNIIEKINASFGSHGTTDARISPADLSPTKNMRLSTDGRSSAWYKFENDKTYKHKYADN